VVFLLVMILGMGVEAYGQTNVYHSFPDSAFWRVDAWAEDNFTGCQENYYFHYYFGGDTIINGNSYKKLMRGNVLIIRVGGGPLCYIWPWATFSGYMGAIKDDSISNKAYFVQPNQINDTLLFDYNLIIGDTLNGFNTGCNNMVVTSIDSILIGMEYRKRWNFNRCNADSGFIIQGIGSSSGLIEPINQTFSYSNLICVKDSNSTLFNSSFQSIIGCQLVTSTQNIPSEIINTINIYPNPTSGTFTLTYNSQLSLLNSQLIITDVLGRAVYHQAIINPNNTTINISQLSNGVYFYEIQSGNSTGSLTGMRGKIVVEK